MMRLAVSMLGLGLGLVAAVPAAAQQRAGSPSLVGTWRFDLRQGEKEGPRTVIVRSDSSASYGEETVRWRIVGDSLWLAIGGEWEVYGFRLQGSRLVLSGGDLVDPITFNRAGPATPRPDSVPVPPDPKRRAM